MPRIWLHPNKTMRFTTVEEAAETLDAMPVGCAVRSGKTIVITQAVDMTFARSTSKPFKPAPPLRAPARSVDDLLPPNDRQTALPRRTIHTDR